MAEKQPDNDPMEDPQFLAETSFGQRDVAADTNALTATFLPLGDTTETIDAEMPKTLGRYEITKPLGRGAFGVVYLGWDPQLKRQVAIKVPRLKSNQGEEQLDALIEEARRAVQLERHQGIVPVYDVGREDQLCYIVSQFVNGGTLNRYSADNKLSLAQKLNLIATVADTIAFAHQQGWVHRDIKPSNILVDTEGRPFLTDFGLTARLEELQSDTSAQGTPYYMAPELIRGVKAHMKGEDSSPITTDQRADVYSLGVVLYELLAGRLPFQSDDLTQLFDKVLQESPEPLRGIDETLLPQVEQVCLRALAKDPNERFQTAEELCRQLRVIEEVAEASRAAVSLDHSSNQSFISTRRVTVAVTIVLLAVVSLIVYVSTKATNDNGRPLAPGKPGTPHQLAQLTDDAKQDSLPDAQQDPSPPSVVLPTQAPANPRIGARHFRKLPAELAIQMDEIQEARDANKQKRELALVEEAAVGFQALKVDSAAQSIAGESTVPSKSLDRQSAYTRLGKAQLRSGFLQQAVNTLEYALKSTEPAQTSDVKLVEILFALGKARSKAGDQAAALFAYQSAGEALKRDGTYKQKKQLLRDWTSLLIDSERNSQAKQKLDELRSLVNSDDVVGKTTLDDLSSRLQNATESDKPQK